MKTQSELRTCECLHELSRREFLRSAAAGVTLAATGTARGLAAPAPSAKVQASPGRESETLATTLYQSLTEAQRREICFPFDNPLRHKVDNNWYITKSKVGTFLNRDQQEMVRQIFMGIHSPEYADRVYRQVQSDNAEDDGGGFAGCSVALFGEPGRGQFEFVFTGRHVTRRCDGDCVAGAAFGGPIFYGHAPHEFNEKPDHPDNIYWFQARRANEVFQALDGRQRGLALQTEARAERGTETVKLSGQATGLQGIPMSELSRDQAELVRKVLGDLLAPFRKADADEAMRLVERNGFDKLHLAYFKNHDIGDDGVWDVWQIEGPAMLWYFRGSPHVHTWVHIRESA